MIKGRHIRHDWRMFADWEQKSVKGACGVTTQRHLAGIPGFTQQPEVVRIADKNYYGWCARCVRHVQAELNAAEQQKDNLAPGMVEQYARFADALIWQWDDMVVAEQRRRASR